MADPKEKIQETVCGFKMKRKEEFSGRRVWSAMPVASRGDEHLLPLATVKVVLIVFEQYRGAM